MCFYMSQKDSIPKVEKRFKAKVDRQETFLQSDFINGFDFAQVPIIRDSTPQSITTQYHWGLVPSWSKDLDFRKNTLNARIETLAEKPSFSKITSQRCLVLATSYFEWHWNDDKGKTKEKYQIFAAQDQLFALAGIYDAWINPQTGNYYHSFAIVTTQANPQMEYIHNHKKRMPIMLKKEDETAWLDSKNDYKAFAFPYTAEMIAFKVPQ